VSVTAVTDKVGLCSTFMCMQPRTSRRAWATTGRSCAGTPKPGSPGACSKATTTRRWDAQPRRAPAWGYRCTADRPSTSMSAGSTPLGVRQGLRWGRGGSWWPPSAQTPGSPPGRPPLGAQTPGLPKPPTPSPPFAGRPAHPVPQTLRLVAGGDGVLPPGHPSVREVAWLLDEARLAGISRVLLPPPSYTVPAMSAAQAAELTGQGVYAEVTANQLLRQPGC